MSRSPLSRLSALLWAVLFLLNTAGDGLGLHPCPHHDSVGGGHAEAGIAPPAGDAGHAHAGGHSAPSAPEEHAGGCTCVGACQSGGGAALPSSLSVTLRADLPETAASGLRVRDVLVPRYPPHFLPFGLAPPARG